MTANQPFSKIIDEMDAEIGLAYLPGCIAWVDLNFNEAWSKLLDQFDSVLLTRDDGKVQLFAQMYRTQVMGYIAAYKKSRSLKQTSSFLSKIKAEGNPHQPAT